MSEQVFANARIVTPDGVVHGRLVVRDGSIADVAADGAATGLGEDLEGDLLLPGLIEVHTDNLEKQVQPRPKVRWPGDAALMAHDAQVAAAGITTVCDAICVGFYGGKQERLEFMQLSLDAIRHGRASGTLKSSTLITPA